MKEDAQIPRNAQYVASACSDTQRVSGRVSLVRPSIVNGQQLMVDGGLVDLEHSDFEDLLSRAAFTHGMSL